MGDIMARLLNVKFDGYLPCFSIRTRRKDQREHSSWPKRVESIKSDNSSLLLSTRILQVHSDQRLDGSIKSANVSCQREPSTVDDKNPSKWVAWRRQSFPLQTRWPIRGLRVEHVIEIYYAEIEPTWVGLRVPHSGACRYCFCATDGACW
jgi:hypothetical protein